MSRTIAAFVLALASVCPIVSFAQPVAGATAVQSVSSPVDDPAAPQPSVEAHGVPNFHIKAGQRLSAALTEFAASRGWHVVWELPQDWLSPSETEFHGDFLRASEDFIKDMSSNGVDIHGRYYTGNRTLVVFGSGGGQND